MGGKHGFGAKFFLHDGATPGVLVEIADIIGVVPPSPTVETIDTTTHGSVGGVREFIAGLIDPGEGTVRVNWVPGSASDVLLAAAILSREVRAFKINVPASGTATRDFTGNCVVTGYEKDDVVIDDKMTAVLTIKASGLITEAAGA